MADRALVTLGMKCPRPLFEVSKTALYRAKDGGRNQVELA